MRVSALILSTVATAGTIGLALGSSRPATGAAAVATPPTTAAGANLAGADFFEAKIRPLLVEQCVACHQGAKAQGGLDLKSREALMTGGVLGPAVVPGDPDKSLLVQVVRYGGHLKMPPKGKLPTEQIALLEEWVRQGAPWGATAPAGGAATVRRGQFRITDADRRTWAFAPVREPKLPAVKNAKWGRNGVDRFVLARLEKAGLKPNPWADRRTLLRRATFDLTGLPPTPEETEAFQGDRRPDAYERVIDRLLASPSYGERWGRHWLDIARYADSNGADWNEVFPNAWRYRDWVIRSLNADKPYDQFIREQIAGDLLPSANEEQRLERMVATGVLVMGPKLLAQQDRVQLGLDVIDEQIDLTTKAFMGITVSCARCHDHKFDPISTKDYYALAGIFKSTQTLGSTLPRNSRVMYWHERPLVPETVVKNWETHQQALRKMQDAMKKAKEATEKERLTAELKDLEAKAPPAPALAMAVTEAKPTTMRVHLRGNYRNLGDEAPRRFLTVLGGDMLPEVPADRSGRLELAEWIASPRNPLTARVMVNRVWQGHFGEGLVRTPDNWGKLGEKPSHPELLDYLALRFVGDGWSLKKLHRHIMLSAAYQQSSAHRADAYARDPENRLLWRMNRRRLEAEAIRDAVLHASGQLDPTAGGTLITKTLGFPVKEFPINFEVPRRSVYLPVVRGGVYPVLRGFDFADPSIVVGKRDRTTVSTQALLMMNSPFVLEQSRKFADSLGQLADTDRGRIEAAYRRALGRVPSSGEVARVEKFLDGYAGELTTKEPDPEKRRQEAWRAFSQTLFASSEFRYVD